MLVRFAPKSDRRADSQVGDICALKASTGSHNYTSRLRSTAAPMKDENSGCGSNGRDFSSGWN